MKIQLSDHFTGKRLLCFCLSPILMMVFTSVYTIVDGYFVSNYVGKIPFAAVNLMMPPINIIGALGFMVGAGGSALIGQTLGKGKREEANRVFTMLVLFTALLGIIFSAAMIFLLRPIALALGATQEMLPVCVLYGGIIMVFNPLFMLQCEFQNYIAVAEKPRLGLLVTVAAGITNMLLDALFVAVFRWGVAGAAIATGISQCIGTVIPLIYFSLPNTSLLRFRKAWIDLRVIRKVCANGSSEFVSNISGSIVGMLFNYQLLRFAGENGVAAYGTLMYIQFIFVAVFIGYTIGAGPVVSYHYGADNRLELKNLFQKSIVFTSATGAGMMVAAFLLARPLARIFVGYDAQLLEMTIQAFRFCSVSFVFMGVNIFASSFFTALGNGGVSAAISFLRTLVFQTLTVLILPALFELNGIWGAISVAELLALAVSLAFFAANRKKYGY